MPFPMPPAPPAQFAPATHQLPPLSFAGFTAHMSIPEARDRITAAAGRLDCRSASDPRLRECTGTMALLPFTGPIRILISSVHDSAAVIVLTARTSAAVSTDWITRLTASFGVPNREQQPGARTSLQWIRRKQMLRLVIRGGGTATELAITLTDGPLLDGLGR